MSCEICDNTKIVFKCISCGIKACKSCKDRIKSKTENNICKYCEEGSNNDE